MAAAALAAAAGPSGHGPVADGISPPPAAAVRSAGRASAGERPGRRAAGDGQPARGSTGGAAGPEASPHAAARAVAASPDAASGGDPHRSPARSDPGRRGRALDAGAGAVRHRAGPARDGFAGPGRRPIDPGPGRRAAARPRLGRSARRDRHHERPRHLQADAGDPRIAPASDRGAGRGGALPGDRRRERPGGADRTHRRSRSQPRPARDAEALALLPGDAGWQAGGLDDRHPHPDLGEVSRHATDRLIPAPLPDDGDRRRRLRPDASRDRRGPGHQSADRLMAGLARDRAGLHAGTLRYPRGRDVRGHRPSHPSDRIAHAGRGSGALQRDRPLAGIPDPHAPGRRARPQARAGRPSLPGNTPSRQRFGLANVRKSAISVRGGHEDLVPSLALRRCRHLDADSLRLRVRVPARCDAAAARPRGRDGRELQRGAHLLGAGIAASNRVAARRGAGARVGPPRDRVRNSRPRAPAGAGRQPLGSPRAALRLASRRPRNHRRSTGPADPAGRVQPLETEASMRSLIGICLLIGGALLPLPAEAQEVESLRKELEQMRKQFDTMKDGYEKAINRLGERIQQLENRPQPAAAPPAAAPPPAAVAQAAAPAVTINPMDLARPREPFSLYGQRGPGQLLFDIGVAGDFIGNLTQSNVDKANAGSFPGRENRFFPREIELALFGQIDPYARAEVRFEAGEEDQGEINVHLAEAHLTLMALPFGTQLKMGQMRNRFGLLNPVHEHDRPFIDAPNVLARFLGEEGLVERGAELTWVAPLPFFLEALVGAFNGDNETAFGRGKLTAPLVTGRLRTFFELGDESAIQLGASVANGETPERHRNTLLGFDAKYKYRPEGWQHPLRTLLGEMIYQNRRGDVLGEDTK